MIEKKKSEFCNFISTIDGRLSCLLSSPFLSIFFFLFSASNLLVGNTIHFQISLSAHISTVLKFDRAIAARMLLFFAVMNFFKLLWRVLILVQFIVVAHWNRKQFVFRFCIFGMTNLIVINHSQSTCSQSYNDDHHAAVLLSSHVELINK